MTRSWGSLLVLKKPATLCTLGYTCGCSYHWDKKQYMDSLFTIAPLHLDNFSVRLPGLSNLAHAHALQSVSHHIKAFGTRIVGVVGHMMPIANKCSFLLLIAVVACRYEMNMDPTTKPCQCQTHGWSRSGVTMTRHKGRTLFPTGVHIGKKPSPLHQLFLSHCHIAVWHQTHATGDAR